MKFIKFIPVRGKENSYISPSKTSIPDWWKNGEININVNDMIYPGMKTCIPFMEIMNIGYCLVTPFDIYIIESKDKQSIEIKWNEEKNVIDERPSSLGSTIPRPAGHRPNHFAWQSIWGWKTPKGWSTIVTHPFNRYDLPFTTLSGIIDSDGFNANGNMPFFIKEGFSGLIPAGTPFAQLIPIKRKKWKMWIDDSEAKKARKQGSESRQEKTSYKKKYWKKSNRNFE